MAGCVDTVEGTDCDAEILSGWAQLSDFQQWIMGNQLESLCPYFDETEVAMDDLKGYNDLTIEFRVCFSRI